MENFTFFFAIVSYNKQAKRIHSSRKNFSLQPPNPKTSCGLLFADFEIDIALILDFTLNAQITVHCCKNKMSAGTRTKPHGQRVKCLQLRGRASVCFYSRSCMHILGIEDVLAIGGRRMHFARRKVEGRSTVLTVAIGSLFEVAWFSSRPLI